MPRIVQKPATLSEIGSKGTRTRKRNTAINKGGANNKGPGNISNKSDTGNKEDRSIETEADRIAREMEKDLTKKINETVDMWLGEMVLLFERDDHPIIELPFEREDFDASTLLVESGEKGVLKRSDVPKNTNIPKARKVKKDSNIKNIKEKDSDSSVEIPLQEWIDNEKENYTLESYKSNKTLLEEELEQKSGETINENELRNEDLMNNKKEKEGEKDLSIKSHLSNPSIKKKLFPQNSDSPLIIESPLITENPLNTEINHNSDKGNKGNNVNIGGMSVIVSWGNEHVIVDGSGRYVGPFSARQRVFLSKFHNLVREWEADAEK